MADVKISNLPAADTPLAGTEEIPLVQDGVTKKATVDDIVAAASAGVTDVTATAPVVSSGGSTPDISMAAASASTSGYLTSTDWNTFNNKQPAGSYLTSGGALGTPSSGTATNLTGLPLSTGVTGTLPVANGGTGTATPALVAGTNVTITGTWPNQTINSTAGGSGTVTSVATGTGLTGGPITTSGTIALADTAVTPGTYTAANITVDAQGRITAAANGSGGGGGTVTSVAATVPSFLSVSGSPITTSGTLAISYSGTALPIANGGTNATTATAARTNLLPSYASNNGKVLAVNSGATDVEWIDAGGVGTVTSVGGTGTVSGISLSGTVTSSGNLTLGGTLDLSTPPAIGGTTPAAVTGTTVTATTKFVGPYFDANSSSGGALRTNGGSACLQWGAGGGVNLTLDGAFNMNPANASISIAPTGTGSLTINPATAGTISNMAISGSSNTLSNIGNSSLTNSSVTVNGTAISLGASGTITVPISTGVTGLGTDVATALAVNIGSAGAPVVNGGALGTPSSGTLTNATGLPISTGVSGLGTGVATFLTTPNSSNLLAAITDETGTGALVFGTAPTLTNPTITNYTETAYSANSSTAISIALTNGTVQIITLTDSATITMPTAAAGKSFIMYLRQDATGSRTVTWSTVNWPGGTAPTITATASKQDIYSFFSDGTSWYGVTVGQNYTQ